MEEAKETVRIRVRPVRLTARVRIIALLAFLVYAVPALLVVLLATLFKAVELLARFFCDGAQLLYLIAAYRVALGIALLIEPRKKYAWLPDDPEQLSWALYQKQRIANYVLRRDLTKESLDHFPEHIHLEVIEEDANENNDNNDRNDDDTPFIDRGASNASAGAV